MKHARSILNQINTSSVPSLEAAYIAFEVNESTDLSDSVLALESMALIQENDELDQETNQINDRSERLDTLVDYVDSQVNNQEGGATENEIALVEQAVDCALDGTGEETEVVLPALESAIGSNISLEGLKETISNFLSAAGEMIKQTFVNFGKFVKGVFSRLSALKTRIEKIEGKLSGELSDSVHVTASAGLNALVADGKVLKTLPAMTAATNDFAKYLGEIVNKYGPSVLSTHAEITKLVTELFETASGRGEEKQGKRDELGKEFVTTANKLIDLNVKIADGKVRLGDWVIKPEGKEKATDFISACKLTKASIPLPESNKGAEEDTDVTGFTKAAMQSHLKVIKESIGLLSKVRVNDDMKVIDFFTRKFTFGVLDPLVAVAINGVSTSKFTWGVNAINAAFMTSYTRVQMRAIDHFFRIANAQLAILEKAVK